MQSESPILRDLREYYDKNKILSTNFDCKHLVKCQGCRLPTPVDATIHTDAEDTFTQAKAAFVGDRYCEHVPRLLFVSLDPGSVLKHNDPKYNYISPESRTLAGVWEGNTRIMREIVKGKSIPRQRLDGTNQVAEAILRAFSGIPQGEHAMRFYAHINAAKCTTNKKERKQADKELFKNCREYLRGEIDALCPDIIITHGDKARRGVKHAFQRVITTDVCKNALEIRPKNGKRLFWLHTYHPSSFGRPKFISQMEGTDDGPGLDGYAKFIHHFISNRDS